MLINFAFWAEDKIRPSSSIFLFKEQTSVQQVYSLEAE